MRAARLPHRPGLDRLRGVAVAAVVAYHLGHLGGGFLGVDVFFVLSGYLVTSLVLAEAAASGGRIDLVAFWRARFRRLVPAVMVLVPAVLLGARAARWPSHSLDDLAVDGVATATWWENWRQVAAGQSYWDPAPSPFRHAWSLAIEEQFYVVWPLLVAAALAVAAGRFRSRRLVGVVAGAGVVVGASWHLWSARRLDPADLSRVYLGTDTRVFTILAGCALACTRWGLAPDTDGVSVRGPSVAAPAAARRTLAIACSAVGAVALAVMAATVSVDDPVLFRRGGFLTATAAAVLLVASIGSGAWGSSVATAPARAAGSILGHLGTRSYGIYLWSWPAQVLVQHRWPELDRGLRSLVVVASSLAVAEASYRLVEHPIRRGTGWAATPLRRRPAWAVGVVVPLVAVALTIQAGTAEPVHQRLETEDALEIARNQPTVPGDGSPGAGEPAAVDGLHLLVIGDSVAFTIGYYKPPIEDWPSGISWIDSRSVIGCGVLASAGWEYPDDSGRLGPAAGGDCEIQADVEALGLAEGPDVVVTFPGAWEVFGIRSPSGERVEPMTPRMEEVLTEALLARAVSAHDAGAAFFMVGWACPPADTPPARRDPEYIEWIDGVLARIAERARSEHGVDARYLRPGDQVCEGGITGDASAAKEGWMSESNHVPDLESGVRLWKEWLGPLLVAEAGQG